MLCCLTPSFFYGKEPPKVLSYYMQGHKAALLPLLRKKGLKTHARCLKLHCYATFNYIEKMVTNYRTLAGFKPKTFSSHAPPLSTVILLVGHSSRLLASLPATYSWTLLYGCGKFVCNPIKSEQSLKFITVRPCTQYKMQQYSTASSLSTIRSATICFKWNARILGRKEKIRRAAKLQFFIAPTWNVLCMTHKWFSHLLLHVHLRNTVQETWLGGAGKGRQEGWVYLIKHPKYYETSQPADNTFQTAASFLILHFQLKDWGRHLHLPFHNMYINGIKPFFQAVVGTITMKRQWG